jgi:hypothetical protein
LATTGQKTSTKTSLEKRIVTRRPVKAVSQRAWRRRTATRMTTARASLFVK